MRAASWVRWATCALAVSLCVPALADRTRRSLSDCTSFDQVDKGDAKVAFTIRNACSVPVDCAISWRVVCAPESRTRRASHPGAARFALAASGGSETAEASAALCGDASWTIDSVHWSCEPSKD
jgi:hypothetical protein